jgi:hypothetical protein
MLESAVLLIFDDIRSSLETTELIESNYDHLKVNKKLYVLNADRRYKMMSIAEYSFITDVKSEVSALEWKGVPDNIDGYLHIWYFGGTTITDDTYFLKGMLQHY